jgi:hypothetical protein
LNDNKLFKPPLKKFLPSNSFFSIEEFTLNKICQVEIYASNNDASLILSLQYNALSSQCPIQGTRDSLLWDKVARA